MSLTPLPRVVIDTNWVLDLLVFHDPRAQTLLSALRSQTLQWLVCARMRDELERVLGYPLVSRRLQANGHSHTHVLDQFDVLTHAMDMPPCCSISCADPDDQVFIDLAVQHQAHLLSKDRQVLKLRSKLARIGVPVMQVPSTDW